MKIISSIFLLIIVNSCCTKHIINKKDITIEGLSPQMVKVLLDVCNNKYNLSSYSYPLIIVDFILEEDVCYLFVAPSPFYNKERTKGCASFKNKIVAFYNSDHVCINGFVDITKLKNLDLLQGMTEQKTIIEEKFFFDPVGLKYKILDQGRLKLVHKGSF